MENNPKEENKDKSPFVNLSESDLKGPNSDFYELPDFPGMVIRRSYLPFMEKYAEGYTNQDAALYWAKLGREWKNIGEQYGIRTPKTEYVVGHDPHSEQPSLFLLTEKIEGENLKTLASFEPNEKEKAKEELDKTYAGIFSHIRDSYKEEGYFWVDPRNDQFMYGTIRRDSEKHVYLADAEPNIDSWKDYGKNEKKDYIFWEKILMAFREMKLAEMKFGKHPVHFNKARDVFSRIVKEFPEPKNEKARDMRFAVLMEH
jgi:hypothetical protein